MTRVSTYCVLIMSYLISGAYRGAGDSILQPGGSPPNFLAEGTVVADVAIFRQEPFLLSFHEREVVAFRVFDMIREDAARGKYVGGFPGIVRPILDWETTKGVEL